MTISYARQGAITVATAGTRVQGPDVPGKAFRLSAATATTIAYVGDVTVTAANGYPLRGTTIGNSVVIDVPNLSLLWFDAAVNGEKVCWLRIK
jgi:hypothetical protein